MGARSVTAAGWRAVGTALILGAGLIVGPAAPAGAHATLVGTVPAADEVVDALPDAVELRFDEPVEIVDDAVQVYGPEGDRVDVGTVDTADGGATLRAPVDADARGTYTVAWRVTSEDSHTLTGSFVFHNGTRTGGVAIGDGGDTAADLVGGVGRWLGYAGTLAAAGAAALALVRPHRRADGFDPPSARLRRLAMAGALVGAVGTVVALVAMLAESSGRGLGHAVSLVPDLAPETRAGQLALVRTAFCLAAGSAAAAVAVWRRSPAPALGFAGGALVAAALAGHAWTAPDRWVAVTSDIAHLGALAVWVGGLVALLAVLPVVAADERVHLASRFSAVALVAVGVVAVSGTVSGWQQVRSLDALTSTTYGRLLLAKVAGFAMLVALGWLNRSRLVPLVERAVAPLRRSLRVETAVAAVVLAVTAGLVHEPPARTVAPAEPFDTTVTDDGGRVMSATVDPATPGANAIHLYFYEGAGTEPLAVDAVQVTAATTGVPARRLQVTPVTTNHVTVAGASLPSAGSWTIEVTAVQAGKPLVFTFEVPIS